MKNEALSSAETNLYQLLKEDWVHMEEKRRIKGI